MIILNPSFRLYYIDLELPSAIFLKQLGPWQSTLNS